MALPPSRAGVSALVWTQGTRTQGLHLPPAATAMSTRSRGLPVPLLWGTLFLLARELAGFLGGGLLLVGPWPWPVAPRGLLRGVEAALAAGQRAALVDLYSSTGGSSWATSTNWLSGDPCGAPAFNPAFVWSGVACSATGTDVTYVMRCHFASGSVVPPAVADSYLRCSDVVWMTWAGMSQVYHWAKPDERNAAQLHFEPDRPHVCARYNRALDVLSAMRCQCNICAFRTAVVVEMVVCESQAV